MWMARRELSMKEQVAVHKTNMAVAEEEYVSLVEREKDLAAAAEELARRQEYQQAELDTLQEEAAQAKELGEDLPQQLQVLREQVTTEKDEVERESTKVKGDEMVKRRCCRRTSPRWTSIAPGSAFGSRLATRRSCDSSTGTWTGGSRREFMVAVRVVDAGGYELMDCDPDMGDAAQRLLAECNRTDDLSGFVGIVAKLFRESVAEEEVAAAAARSGRRRRSRRRATRRWMSPSPNPNPSLPARPSTPSPTIWCPCELVAVVS